MADKTTNARLFHIHGDNIVECERTLHLIRRAVSGLATNELGPSGIPTNPSFLFELPESGENLEFVFFPGFGRWKEDIMDLVRSRGGILREAPDAIITEVTSGEEFPLMAIEFSAALAAGNQAWQRSGRAYSFGLGKIPYLYVAEIGGKELDADRNPKAIRLPNPAVPFSYLSFTSDLGIPVLPVFIPSPGVNPEMLESFAPAIGEEALVELTRETILAKEMLGTLDSLKKSALQFITGVAISSRRNRGLTPSQWMEAYQAVSHPEGMGLVTYLLSNARIRWSKISSIRSLTTSAKELMTIASQLGIGLTSATLPICLIPPENRSEFAEQIARLYPKIEDAFLQWVQHEAPLAVCWVMGFKPRGDDARPDRGLPPMTRMLIGSETELLTVIYGPAPVAHWDMLAKSPPNLARQNGLWAAIMSASDAILVDSSTDNVTNLGFLRNEWQTTGIPDLPISTLVSPIPKRIGENDVDTVLHTVFAHFAQSQVFEGLCNPPGGDWSGISLLTPDKSKELRWLSLPRVSGQNTKRPDHVLELFEVTEKPIVFSIESKETSQSMEQGIGPWLNAYMIYLLKSPASIERETVESKNWNTSNLRVNLDDFDFASGAAFLMRSTEDLATVGEKSNVDLQIGLQFSHDNKTCQIHLLPSTPIGVRITYLMNKLELGDIGVSVQVH